MSRKFIRKTVLTTAGLITAGCLTVQAANCVVYTVEKGDSLWKISQNYQVDLDDVIEYNPQIKNPDLIYPEEKVYVPVSVVDREPSKNNADNNENGGTTITEPGEIDNPDVQEPGNENSNTENPATEEPGTDSGTGQPEQGQTQNAEGLSELEAEVLRLVNEERAKAGLSALTLNTAVTDVARTKSKDMIDKKYFAHNSPTYGSPSQMLTSFGISYRAAGENIAYGQQTAKDVMNAWMNSSGHRANILSSTYTQIGIGCVSMNNGTLYWTQMFITP